MTTAMRIRALVCAAVTLVAAVATAFVQEHMTGASSAIVIFAVAGVAILCFLPFFGGAGPSSGVTLLGKSAPRHRPLGARRCDRFRAQMPWNGAAGINSKPAEATGARIFQPVMPWCRP
jgi:hypothetical protein